MVGMRAAALGFLKPEKYAAVERERRWLCASLPDLPVVRAEALEDLYVDGSRLRLRRATPVGRGEPILRLSKKADLAPDRRLITTLYLTPAEYALFERLPGRPMRKTRHYYAAGDVTLSVDRFDGPLAGLFLAEAEFADDAAMAAFPHPAFAVREVTADPRYTGGELVRAGIPDEGG
jgi:CYTH domain-containing protein